MKRLAVIVAVVCLFALAQHGWAADLQAGWYVNLGGVSLYGKDPNTGQDRVVEWNFVGGIGTHGPFHVSAPDPSWPQRQVSVPSEALFVPTGTGVDLAGEPVAPFDFSVQSVYFACDTYYVSSQMRLDLLIRHADAATDLVWSQTASGHVQGGPQIDTRSYAFDINDGLLFRVATVPEPGSAAIVALPLALLTLRLRRR